MTSNGAFSAKIDDNNVALHFYRRLGNEESSKRAGTELLQPEALPVSTSTYESIKIDDFKYSTRRMPTRNDLRSELKKLPSHAEAEFIIPSENPHPFRGDNQNP